GADRRHVTVSDLGVTIGSQAWHLASGAPAAKIAWSKEGISISSLPLVTGQSDEQKIDISGTWQQDGSGALRVAATHVFLDTLGGSFEAPPRYGGVLDLDATVRGTVQKPIVTGSVTISDGRFRRFSYQGLAGRVDYSEGDFDVDVRLDQSPGVWITIG